MTVLLRHFGQELHKCGRQTDCEPKKLSHSGLEHILDERLVQSKTKSMHFKLSTIPIGNLVLQLYAYKLLHHPLSNSMDLEVAAWESSGWNQMSSRLWMKRLS
jgi:hypothetical protein